MEIDFEKIDEMVLALLQLTSFADHGGYRAWKGIDWEVANRLSEKDYIYDPKNKNKSVAFTAEGYKRSKELFEQYFVKKHE